MDNAVKYPSSERHGPSARLRGEAAWSRWLVAVALAAGCAIVLHTRVYSDFERVRVRVVSTAQAASAGAVVAALPDLAGLAGQPAALVLRLTNASAAPREVRIAAGGVVLGEAVVPPARGVRVDLSLSDGAVLTDSGRVEVTAAASSWSLDHLEVANVHGFSSGLFELQITPASAPTPQRLGALASVSAFGLLAAFYGLLWHPIVHRWGRRTYAALSVLVASFLVAVFAAPFVSDFAVHLAPHTLAVCVAVLYYPPLAVVARRLRPPLEFGLQAAWGRRHHAMRAARRVGEIVVRAGAFVLAFGASLSRAVVRGAAWAGRYYVVRPIRRVAPVAGLALRCGRRVLSAFRQATHMTVTRALQIVALTALAVTQPPFRCRFS